jgi:hypothetical protein
MFIIAFELKFSRAFPWGFRVQRIIGLEDSMYPTVYGSNLQSVRDHHEGGCGIFMRSRRGKKRIQPVRSNIIQFQRLIQASTDDLCLACELQSLGRETVLICNRQRVDEAGP